MSLSCQGYAASACYCYCRTLSHIHPETYENELPPGLGWRLWLYIADVSRYCRVARAYTELPHIETLIFSVPAQAPCTRSSVCH